MLLQEDLKLSCVEIAKHEIINFNHRHERLATQLDRPLPCGGIAAGVAHFVIPLTFIELLLGFLALAVNGAAVENDVFGLLERLHEIRPAVR